MDYLTKVATFYFVIALSVIVSLAAREGGGFEGSGDDNSDASSTKVKTGGVNVPLIYKMALPMISGEKPINSIRKFLMTYFLDETSPQFIWPKLAEELEENFNQRHSMTDLDRMERHIRDFKDKLNSCAERKGKLKSECLLGFVDLLLDNKNDFWWGSTSKGVRFLNFFVSFHLIVLSGMQMCRIQFESHPLKGIAIDQRFKEDVEFFKTQTKNQAWETCEWRKNEISSVETCKVVDIFGQEYTLYCQDRLTRSEIAKDTNDFMESFRATVYDSVTGEKCFTKRETVRFGKNKAQVEESLFNVAIKVRDACVKKANDECTKYWQARAYSLADEVAGIKLKPGKKKHENTSS